MHLRWSGGSQLEWFQPCSLTLQLEKHKARGMALGLCAARMVSAFGNGQCICVNLCGKIQSLNGTQNLLGPALHIAHKPTVLLYVVFGCSKFPAQTKVSSIFTFIPR
jgi:hypothetical protein